MAGSSKGVSAVPKQVAERIGRMFNLLFNRVSMYHLDHPSTKEAITMLGRALDDGLKHTSPLAVILDREIITVEDEPLDPRVNTQRLVAHMQKTGVKSVSFEKGVMDQELLCFARVFSDLRRYPDADQMREELARQWVQRVRINHVFFKKMTEDEEVVEAGTAHFTAPVGLTQMLVDTASELERAHKAGEKAPPEVSGQVSQVRDLLQSLSLTMLLENPRGVSEKLLEAETDAEAGAGGALIEGIRHLRSQVEAHGALPGGDETPGELVGAVFRLRETLLKEVDLRRRRGELSGVEARIQSEMDDLTDQALVQLVREEYKKGEISVKRLAQIIRRMLPDIRDLRRLLPKLKTALLAEGMPLADYLQLIRELERELQSEEIARVLEEGAEEIGLAVEDLIEEVRRDPKVAAELIAIAAEVRSLGPGADEGVLSRILVEYVERVSEELAIEETVRRGAEGFGRMREILSRVRRDLVEELRARLAGSTLMGRVEGELEKRRPPGLEELQRAWVLRQLSGSTQSRLDTESLADVVKRAYPEPSKQEEILGWVIQAMEAKGIDPGPLRATLTMRGRAERDETEVQKPPKGTLNRPTMLFLIQEEIKRGLRFDYVFSTLLVSVRQATALRPIPIGFVKPHEIRNAIMEQMIGRIRDVDLVGIFDEGKVILLLPFTGEQDASQIAERIFDELNGARIDIREIPVRITLAWVHESFQRERTPTLKSLLFRLEKKLEQALLA